MSKATTVYLVKRHKAITESVIIVSESVYFFCIIFFVSFISDSISLPVFCITPCDSVSTTSPSPETKTKDISPTQDVKTPAPSQDHIISSSSQAPEPKAMFNHQLLVSPESPYQDDSDGNRPDSGISDMSRLSSYSWRSTCSGHDENGITSTTSPA